MKHEFSAGVIVFYPGTHGPLFLLIYSKTTNYWGFPKGKLEKGETKQQAALRETLEETGLEVKLILPFEHIISYFFRENWRPHRRLDDDGNQKKAMLIKKTVYFFVGQAHSEQVTLSREHDDFVWLSYADARSKITYDNDSEAFERAVAFLKTEKL